MMGLGGGPWLTRLAMILITIGIAKASPPLALFLVAAAVVIAIATFIYSGKYLPRYVMDILDKLTNKQKVEEAYAKQSGKLTAINAEQLAEALKSKVIGQNDVIDQISQQLRRRIAAKRQDKPIAVFVFAGAPGVGKTHLAKALSEEIYGSKNHLHFFDMTNFAQPHAAQSLFGSPKGYVGSGSYGALTSALRDLPNSIVLLDEVEKAHPDVLKRFLVAWNDGFITESSDGNKMRTNETIFILTTNAASRRISDIVRDHKGTTDELNKMVKQSLAEANFAPEVLSRIDAVFAFKPLAGLDIARVVALEMQAATRQYGMEIVDGGIDVQILLDSIEALSREQKGGVRDIARAIENQMADGLIDAKTIGAEYVRFVQAGETVEVVPVQKNGDPFVPEGASPNANETA
jgi:ATP-dependent Clp protease ATP-binding subunit ClpA